MYCICIYIYISYIIYHVNTEPELLGALFGVLWSRSARFIASCSQRLLGARRERNWFGDDLVRVWFNKRTRPIFSMYLITVFRSASGIDTCRVGSYARQCFFCPMRRMTERV